MDQPLSNELRRLLNHGEVPAAQLKHFQSRITKSDWAWCILRRLRTLREEIEILRVTASTLNHKRAELHESEQKTLSAMLRESQNGN